MPTEDKTARTSDPRTNPDGSPVVAPTTDSFRNWFTRNVTDEVKVAMNDGTVAPHVILSLMKRAFFRAEAGEPLPDDPAFLVPGTQPVPGSAQARVDHPEAATQTEASTPARQIDTSHAQGSPTAPSKTDDRKEK
jgi:hypothetical protein